MSALEPDPTSELFMRFARIDGETILADRFFRSPLKIAKPFRQPEGRIGCTVMDASPGLMAGDYYRISLELGPEADAFVTNQSSTKVHPNSHNPARQKLDITLEPGSRLDYRPEPLMLYAGGALYSRTEVRLSPGSMLLLSEVLGPGRWLRGEVFLYECCDITLQVSYGPEAEPVFYSRQRHEPRSIPDPLLRAPGIWRTGTHLATLFAFSDRIGTAHKKEWQAWAAAEPQSVYAIGISLTYKYGLALSVIGNSAWELQRIIDEARAIASAW